MAIDSGLFDLLLKDLHRMGPYGNGMALGHLLSFCAIVIHSAGLVGMKVEGLEDTLHLRQICSVEQAVNSGKKHMVSQIAD